ncbi:Cyclopropane-fatty-acyl-phospholipid synthase [Roseivivax sp. THAF40]|uniref:SAM-dependent methyltransferase n=1 Tax=unclassified Roseivivax TaxID=2639302 RepID=UPI00126858B8|nr:MULTISPECIES: cyclopropane-fatty-acyl-phospholipid synthase family protein [unclassified Roseivivax]QFS81311.1 Cyclopropane-fatty-acyl-phospholipid synthase [Roseivivax sp. THAF197b]QFT45040.1 Cyclopropane-fatty-acyl-phospholipid synthase [Roseivivax sp. THAF40]
MWDRMLDSILARLVTLGDLRVTWPDGRETRYGADAPPRAHIILKEPSIVRQLCLRPVLALGEGYMDGRIEISDDDLHPLLALLQRARQRGGRMPRWLEIANDVKLAMSVFLQRNSPISARRNVAHHYDISDDLYRLFLDADMQYSCAYFTDPGMSLEDAQAAKKAHIAAKLRLEPGMRVLDIGCGWGGMALTLARDHGVEVTGVTLSRNQHATAQARAEVAGLSGRIDIRLQDYRHVRDSFDRIVSVGMLEHVGRPQFRTYFGKVAELLQPGGIALVHTIGLSRRPTPTSPWIDKYIFPGGYVPTMSDLAPEIERANLWMADIEVLRGHYARTLHHWRDRFEAALDQVREMYDERFVRMWRFYLVACETAFEEQHQGVFQFQLSHAQQAVPVTRDYLYAGAAGQLSQAAE